MKKAFLIIFSILTCLLVSSLKVTRKKNINSETERDNLVKRSDILLKIKGIQWFFTIILQNLKYQWFWIGGTVRRTTIIISKTSIMQIYLSNREIKIVPLGSLLREPSKYPQVSFSVCKQDKSFNKLVHSKKTFFFPERSKHVFHLLQSLIFF